MAKWLADIAWDKRSREFGELVIAEFGGLVAKPVMEMLLPPARNRDVIDRWMHLPPHPNILEPQDQSTEAVALRYAALHWARTGSDYQPTVAKWGMQLVDAFALIDKEVRAAEKGLFLRPLMKLDIGGHVRLAFPSADRGDVDEQFPSDLRRKWPHCDEAAFVFAVGLLIRQLSSGDDPALETIIRRATDDNRRRRITTLAELRAALKPRAAGPAVRDANAWRSFKLFEEGLGWLALERNATALQCFEDARIDEHASAMVDTACDLARERLGLLPAIRLNRPLTRWQWKVARPETVLAKPPPRAVAPAEAEARGKHLETQRAFRDALECYMQVWSETPAILLGRARCHLQSGEGGQAIDYAQRVLAMDPTSIEAQELVIKGQLLRHDNAQALKRATLFVQAQPKHAPAHHLRGKALFASGRIEEARDSFDRASALDSQLLAAQLLRRECERALGNVRKSVGSQHAPTFEIPEQLAELRDVLISGDIPAAIEALRDERYARDADARLLLARFLMFDGRVEAALAIFDELTATSHREAALVGKGTALLQLGRAGAALAIFDQLRENADAAEGAARAYEQLGLLDAAADAYKRFVALATNSSDLRVRAAQLWLEEH